MSKTRRFKGVTKELAIVVGMTVALFTFVYYRNYSTRLKSHATSEKAVNGCVTKNITISPANHIFKPGETVNFEVKFKGDVDVNKTSFRIAPASRKLVNDPYPAKDLVLKNVSKSVGVNAATGENESNWTGSFVLDKNNTPNDGEYIFWPNIYATAPGAPACVGNPGYTCDGCQNGVLAGTGISTGAESCDGCWATFTLDSNSGNKSGYDINAYFNLKPGNMWKYDGWNLYCGTDDNGSADDWGHPELVYGKCTGLYPGAIKDANGVYKMPFETTTNVEEKVLVCGHTLTPWRMVKSRVEGYNLVNTNLNRRIFVTNFASDQWNSESLGKAVDKDYTFESGKVNSLEMLGKLSSGLIPGRHAANDPLRPVDNNYFAPHFFTEKYVKNGWYYEGWGMLYFGSVTDIFNNCKWPYVGVDKIERKIKNSVYGTNPDGSTIMVDTPAYKGPAIRLSLVECGRGNCNNTSWQLREDWYFASGIGRVKLDYKDLKGKCNISTDDCSDLTRGMTDPTLSMQLSGYYIGGKLKVTIKPDFPTPISKKGLFTLTVTNEKDVPYTGRLEAKACVTAKKDDPCTPGTAYLWKAYVKNGVGVMNLATNPDTIVDGYRRAQFRPLIESTPAGESGEGKTPAVKTAAYPPWSDEVRFYVVN